MWTFVNLLLQLLSDTDSLKTVFTVEYNFEGPLMEVTFQPSVDMAEGELKITSETGTETTVVSPYIASNHTLSSVLSCILSRFTSEGFEMMPFLAEHWFLRWPYKYIFS